MENDCRVLWTRQGHCTLELTVNKTTQTKAAQDQARQNPTMDKGGTHRVLLLARDLFAIDAYSGGQGVSHSLWWLAIYTVAGPTCTGNTE